MASSSSPKPITSPTTSPTATRKPQPIPWTHQETVNLISTYQEKWYSLKRGPLRGTQWEEVAVIVAARCGYHFNYPSKSALQCRHKMEKLRQRHRSEKHRLAVGSSASSRHWQYFRLMDDLERGPQPISVRPLPHHLDEYNDDDGGDDDGDDEIEKVNSSVKSRTRSINYILSQRPRTTTREDEIDDEGEEEEEVIVKERRFVFGLTAEIRGFAERIIGMENLKMEMMKETERFRLEMENKRIRMIHDSQSRIVDSIERAFGSS